MCPKVFWDCILCSQQALENSGLSVVQPQSDAPSGGPQNQNAESAASESKKAEFPEKSLREKRRSIFKKPIQMPGILGVVGGKLRFPVRRLQTSLFEM